MSGLLPVTQVDPGGSAHPWGRLTAMLLGALVVVLAPVALAAEPDPTQPSLRAADWRAIKQVIGDQNRALRAGDAVKAFSYASPGIREQFGTPERFLDMVRAAYGELIAARYTEFLEGAVVDGAVIQPLRLIAPDNTVQVALYTMQKQNDGRWRIAGCVLAPSTVQAA